MDYTKYRECQIELCCLIEDYHRNLLTLVENLECKDRAVAEQAVEKLTNTFHELCCIVSDSLQG